MSQSDDRPEREGYGPAHHWRGGWHFQRCVDAEFGEIGEVLVTRNNYGGEGDTDSVQLLIPPAEWASIIEHVSGADTMTGGTTTYAIAEAFHAGQLARGWLEDSDEMAKAIGVVAATLDRDSMIKGDGPKLAAKLRAALTVPTTATATKEAPPP